MTKKLLIIAGSDSGGGAGLQADIKTACYHKIHSSTIVTSLTAQNTKGVFAIHNPDVYFLKKQLEVIFQDIEFDAIKIGMLANHKIAEMIYYTLKSQNNIKNIVLDPVMISTSGDVLLEKSAINFFKQKMLSLATIITPNIDEAEILSDMKIGNIDDMKLAAQKIKNLGAKNILIKGGHLKNNDNKIYNLLLTEDNSYHLISNKKIYNKQFHGTGCSLASAISCNLCQEFNVFESVKKANKYVYKAIKNSFKIGEGANILCHF
jgi:hydroxymethylpyrimidine/phosphomethylpyrimidine kinase